jgi:hypothetical protein
MGAVFRTTTEIYSLAKDKISCISCIRKGKLRLIPYLHKSGIIFIRYFYKFELFLPMRRVERSPMTRKMPPNSRNI